MFNLEKAITDWLKLFRKHQTFSDGVVREMELHLRDHIDDLVALGCSEKDAFELAVKEFGDLRNIAKEEYQNVKAKTTFISGIVPIGMFKNYFKIAIRNFTKQPFFTFLNTFGLAIGMAGGLLIALFIYDELSFDKMFSDADRIYRINIDNRTKGETSTYAAAPSPMAEVLIRDCPPIELVTRFRSVGSTLMRNPDATLNVKETNVAGADSAFFEMFGIKLLEGDTRTALKDPNTLILTKSAASKHFGSENALGQKLLLNNTDLFVVSGVLDDLPRNSFLRNHTVFISLSSYADAETVAWNTWYFPTFVKLKPHAQVEDLQVFLNDVQERYLIPWAMTFVPGLTIESARAAAEKTGDHMSFNQTALTDIHLYSGDRVKEFSPNSSIQNIYIMSFIGCFLILLASVNFMNLSTANSLKRAKEVGVRKTLGGSRLSLVRQFLTESALISFLSLAIAVLLAMLALPIFNQLADKTLTMPFDNPIFILLLVSVAGLLGLLSGGYPAFFLSRFIPASALKGGQNKAGGSTIRNGLIVFQFAISVFLIISTIVVYEQVSFMKNKELGFQKDQVIIINDVRSIGNQAESFKEEVLQMSQVGGVSFSSYLPSPSTRSAVTYFPEGTMKDGALESAMIIQRWKVDYDYLPLLGFEIIAGRNFDRKFGTDSVGLILNETAVSILGVSPDEAIGMRLSTDFHRQDKENMEYYTVIGVIKNFHFESLRNGIDGLSLSLAGGAEKMIVKLNAGDFSSAIDDIKSKWSKIAQGQPFDFYFMDESFQETYKAEVRLGSIFMTFTVLSIFIACLGLFGLAAFSAERRSKEIGIKKVMGASVKQITYQLSADFLKLVGIATIISVPLGWYAMHKWLEDFSYRIEISWWTFVLAAFISVAISILTVSYQSIKAALANPVASLKSE